MSTMDEAKLPSLKDKLIAKDEEKDDETKPTPKKRGRKGKGRK